MFHNATSAARFIKFAALVYCSSCSEINAATVKFETNEEMGCSISVTGVIEGGDAEKLEDLIKEQQKEDSVKNDYYQLLQSPSGRRICFNSLGGNMVEGMAMARVIAGKIPSADYSVPQGTAVARNARCESACALAFMAGSMTGEEGVVNYNRVIHPTAKLGFHRPSLIVSSGEYSEKAIDFAFSVALDTLKTIIDSRSEGWYKFPESLFMNFLATPSSEMYYIETVGEASRLSIQVAPAQFYSEPFYKANLNFCTSVDGGLLDKQPLDTFGGDVQALDIKPDITLRGWTIEFGFRGEAASGCTVVIFDEQVHQTDRVGYAFIGEYDPDRREDVWPFQSFPSETQITVLDKAALFSIEDFNAVAKNSRPEPIFAACFITSPYAEITNVSEYANLRRQPDFTASVVRQLFLGEVVQPRRADSVSVIGSELDRQLCVDACYALQSNAADGPVRDRVQQCINENMLWYEVTDKSGSRGWVSRKFLQETE